MRAGTLLKSLAVTGVLVLAADHVAIAATGHSLVLGKVNKANQVTTIERTTDGPALNLVTKPGKPPLQVRRAVKVKRLNADLLDGLSSERLALRPVVSSYPTAECRSLASVGNTFTKLMDIATVTKTHDHTLLRLDLANRLHVGSMTATGVIFEMRIDDQPTTLGAANALLRSTDVATPIQHPFFGVFPDVPAGTHTVSVWVRTNSVGSTASTVMVDPGCWNSAGVNNLLVTEF